MVLLGLGMIMDDEVLKCIDYRSRSIYTLAMLMILVRHLSFLITDLRCFHKIQSGLDIDKLLHLIMALFNSSLKNEGQFHDCFNGSSFRRLRST